ncbi:PD-(D/E)XK nuclease domain-containing protein [Paraburkholderia bannensis]|uniref:PD-(D/E)XK nuclease domain-containing protein n=1 Tax=Paraburkholderia bannensis TaxID=765414 RepID=UPI002AB5F5A3|nr:hypothetical protein [Paraburkholderia bannensis]
MSAAEGLLLSDARQTLLLKVREVAGRGNVIEAFAAWALPDRAADLELSYPSSQSAAQLKGSGRTYQAVSILGFALAAGQSTLDLVSSFNDGLDWLLGRAVKPGGTFAQFCYDPLAILGIAVGVRAVGDEASRARVGQWLTTFIPAVIREFNGASWARCLLGAALVLVTQSDLKFEVEDCDVDVAIALAAKGVSSGRTDFGADEEARALVRIKRTQDEDTERAVLMLCALDWLSGQKAVVSLQRPTIEQVGQLLARVPSAMRRWTWEDAPKTRTSTAERWDVQHEYHVQNLLYALLAPLFPDLTDEETLPPVGQKNPRTDLGIPSLKLVVEAKFLRAGHSFGNLIGELSQDAALYRAHGPNARYQYVMPFVWDDSRRTEEYSKFIDGLRMIEGLVHPVIVPRPGQMEHRPSSKSK